MPRTDGPPGDMHDVTSLVEVDHASVRQVLVEASRPTDTPGVRRGLIEQAQAVWATHAEAERQVLFPATAGAGSSDGLEQVQGVQDALDRVVGDLRGDATTEQVAAVLELFDSHVRLME